jgi:hypothetical protein
MAKEKKLVPAEATLQEAAGGSFERITAEPTAGPATATRGLLSHGRHTYSGLLRTPAVSEGGHLGLGSVRWND